MQLKSTLVKKTTEKYLDSILRNIGHLAKSMFWKIIFDIHNQEAF